MSRCPLLRIKWAWRGPNAMSAFDPKRTFEVSFLIRQSLMRMTGVPTSI